MAVITQIEDVFQAMLVVTPAFINALPTSAAPADHIRWLATFEEQIDDDVLRPLALCYNTPFAAARTTEGDDDIPLYESGIYVELQRNDKDFNTGNPQESRKQFKEWYGTILDYMTNWQQTASMQFLRFVNTNIAMEPCRTEIAKRETMDHFWAVGLHFEIDGGQSG